MSAVRRSMVSRIALVLIISLLAAVVTSTRAHPSQSKREAETRKIMSVRAVSGSHKPVHRASKGKTQDRFLELDALQGRSLRVRGGGAQGLKMKKARIGSATVRSAVGVKRLKQYLVRMQHPKERDPRLPGFLRQLASSSFIKYLPYDTLVMMLDVDALSKVLATEGA